MQHKDPKLDIKANFKAWSFAHAELEIQSLLNQKNSNLSDDEKAFLKELLTKINSCTAEIVNLFGTSPLDEDKSSIQRVNTYLAIQSTAFQTVQATTLELINFINEEQQRYDSSIQNNKENLYLDFLKNLNKCCKGMYIRSEGINNAYNNTKPLKDLAATIQDLGGIYIPKTQIFDPLRGSKTTRNALYDDSEGFCAGDVFEWIAQRKKSSDYRITPVFTSSIYQNQKNIYSLKKQLQPYITTSLTDITKLENYFSTIGDDIYYVTIRDFATSGANHAIGIRKIIETGEIEIFDPNYGIFIFKNDKHCHHFFACLMFRMYAINKFSELDFQTAGKQHISGKSLPPYTKNNAVSSNSNWINLDSLYSVISKTFDKNQKDNFNEMSKNRIVNILIDILPCYLYYTKSKKDIEAFESNLLKLKFIFKKSFVNSLFNTDSDPWNNNAATRKIAKMLNERKNALSLTETNSYLKKNVANDIR